MQHKPDDKLERLIHRELAKLPELHAPDTLIPRVLKAIQIQVLKPWWHQPWFNWPLGFRSLSLAIVGVLVSLVFAGSLILWNDATLPITLGGMRDWLASYTVVEGIISTLANAMWIVLNAIGKLWLFLSLGIAFSAYLSCVGIGTVCFRLAINKR